jgi:hypothetical protein
MKLKLLSLLLLAAIAGLAQTLSPTDPLNIWGVGMSWNQSASANMSQQFAGTALYAREQNTMGTYAFGVFDVVPTSYQPFTTASNLGVGVGQKILTVGSWRLYGTAAAGPSWSGPNTGWNWSGGGMATHDVRGKWWVGLTVRTIRSSVNQNSGNQYIFGVLGGMNP